LPKILNIYSWQFLSHNWNNSWRQWTRDYNDHRRLDRLSRHNLWKASSFEEQKLSCETHFNSNTRKNICFFCYFVCAL